jgi:hypothetical protein
VCDSGAGTGQASNQLIPVKKRRLTARFPAEPEAEGQVRAAGLAVVFGHVCRGKLVGEATGRLPSPNRGLSVRERHSAGRRPVRCPISSMMSLRFALRSRR